MLWIVFSIVVIFYTTEQVMLSRDNFAIVQGTDNVLQWWFYVATPFAFSVLIIRCLQNLYEDWACYRKGDPFKIQSSVFGD